MAIDVITLQINHLGITTALIITFGAFEVQGASASTKVLDSSQNRRLFSDSSFSKTSTYPRIKLTQSTITPENSAALSGLDISPVLHGTAQTVTNADGVERKHLFWHFPHNGKLGMKSAIREGDFKLYKRYFTDDYELYRLYKDGQRLDLEEQNNLATDPAYESIVKRLAATLDAELAANDAELPYLNPAYRDHDTEPAKLKETAFESTERLAKISFANGGPNIAEAYVIYQSGAAKSKNKKKGRGESKADSKQKKREARKLARRNQNSSEKPVDDASENVVDSDDNHGSEINGMKQPVMIATDGQSLTAKIPAEVKAYRFMIIDSNNFLQYSDIQMAK